MAKCTKSLGNRVCPKCGQNGSLKVDVRGKTPLYFVSHSYPESKRYPLYGKYKSACYLGKIKQSTLDNIPRTKTGNWWN